MKGTKQRILRAARLLFNQQGVANVSQRAISNHIAISPCNLTYHFKKREEIVSALYDELASELRSIMAGLDVSNATFQLLFDIEKAMNKVLFDNRFFIVDFNQVTRINETIRKDYAQLTQERERLIRSLLDQFIVNGWLRKEELPNEYDFLIIRFQLFSDYWLLSVGAKNEDSMLKHTRIYTEIFMQALYPYITDKGKTSFKAVLGY